VIFKRPQMIKVIKVLL